VRPTVQEQLQGTGRVLEEIIAPHVGDPYAANILKALISNLRMLVDAVPATARFVQWDNRAAAEVLAVMRGSQQADLAAEIGAVLSENEPDPTDWVALDARNQRLRSLLVTALAADRLPSEVDEQLVGYMTERASRHPMRYVLPTPGASRQEQD
jgi:hypothetical protein